MNEQPTIQEEKTQNIDRQNKKMRKKLLIALAVTIGVLAVLISSLLILKACQEKEGDFSLPESYFHPTYSGDIFEYVDYLDKRPDVIFYCDDPNGLGHTTEINDDLNKSFAPEVLYLRDFLKIMMRADVEAYNNCFNEVYYKTHKKQETFSQQMIYEAEIRFGGETKKENGERTAIYYLLYKLYENDGSLRRDVGSDAIVPIIVELRITPAGEISINALKSTRTK